MIHLSDEKFDGIQALRFVAAMLVVVTHATLMVSERLLGTGYQYWGMGRAGVDIFFVISGFVMAISSEKLVDRHDGWRVFATRRLVRIVPMYWLATTAKLAAVIAVPAATLHSEFDLVHIVASYLFLPARNAVGEIQPLLAVGWTLVFEMFFYAVFMLALLLRQSALRFTGLVFGLLAALAMILPKDGPALLYYVDPMLLEFVFGMLVARVWRSGLQVRAWLASAVTAVGFALLYFLEPLAFSEAYAISPRFVAWGLPSMMIVLGVVYLEPVLRPRLSALVLRLGDASYSLYLFHGLLLPVIGIVMARLGLIWPVTAVLVSMAASAVMSLVIYRLAEDPATRWLKGVTQSGEHRRGGRPARHKAYPSS